MSYARWTKGYSDVYVFAHADGGIKCCGCALEPEPWSSFYADTSGEMLIHLAEHKDKGHLVPEGIEFKILGDYPNLNEIIM